MLENFSFQREIEFNKEQEDTFRGNSCEGFGAVHNIISNCCELDYQARVYLQRLPAPISASREIPAQLCNERGG